MPKTSQKTTPKVSPKETPKTTSYGNKGCKDAVWSKAATAKNKSPDSYRVDAAGNTMNYNSYGKSSPQGWQIDHITPQSRGGGDKLRNLQALNSSLNMSSGNTLDKVSRHG